MVDKDKIRKRKESEAKDKGGSSSRSKSKKKTKSKSGSSSKSSSGSSGKKIDRGKSKGEKLEEFKKASGVSTDKSSGSDSVTAGEYAKVLEAMANVLIYTEGNKLDLEEKDSKRASIKEEVYNSAYKEFTEIVSRNEIQRSCEKYGVDWQTGVVEKVVSDQEIDSNVENMSDTSNYVVGINGNKSVSLSDFHRAAIGLAEMIGYPRVLKEKASPPSTNRQKIIIETSSDISAKCIDFAGLFNIPEICEKNGIDWDGDVMGKVGAK